MLSKILNAVLLVIALGFIGYTIYKWPKYGDGDATPTFTAELIDGSQFDLADLKGKYVLLDFWGSWCAPCRRENPEIVSLQQSFGGQQFVDASDFTVVSIGIETNADRWKAAIKKDGLYWPYQILQVDRFQSPIPTLYGVKEIPTKYLLDAEGQVISVNAAPSEIAEYLKGKLK